MAALPDINVLVALSYGAHVHHAAALAWLDAVQKDGDVILCRLSQLGLLRLLNNPHRHGCRCTKRIRGLENVGRVPRGRALPLPGRGGRF